MGEQEREDRPEEEEMSAESGAAEADGSPDGDREPLSGYEANPEVP